MSERLERHLDEAETDLATARRFAVKREWPNARDYLSSAIEAAEHARDDVDRLRGG